MEDTCGYSVIVKVAHFQLSHRNVTVTPVNDTPTLDELIDVNINEDDLEQTVNLTGITAGGGETQVLSIVHSNSDNTGLIPTQPLTSMVRVQRNARNSRLSPISSVQPRLQ